MYQAELVQTHLQKEYPNVKFQIVGMKTIGDKILDVSLSAFSSKGVFTKELDTGLFEKQIDVAVHCVKDLPTILPKGLEYVAILARGTTDDALVLHEKHKGKTLADLPNVSLRA